MTQQAVQLRFGVIGGLGAQGAGDVYAKFIDALSANGRRTGADVIFDAQPFIDAASDDGPRMTARKLHVFDAIRRLAALQAECVLLPCFLSQSFLEELRPEIGVPVVDLMEALHRHLAQHHPAQTRLGVLAPDSVRRSGVFEHAFAAARWTLLYPSSTLSSLTLDGLEAACRDLLAQGAEVILPGSMEIPQLIEALRERGLPVLDCNRAYAAHAAESTPCAVPRPFKIGVVGGVGPAATVDFLDKLVRNTPAGADQEHFKVVVEMNPQIPDRTAHLIGEGVDPTLSLYAACKRLEDDGASLITIPCNTAHAFVGRIQPALSIPIVNMLQETVAFVRQHYPQYRRIGLLATRGTIRSRVYHAIVEAAGLELLVPDEAEQARVMNAIYGEKGVKAGFTEGECRDDLLQALAHLVGRGAEVVLLGCTELPLLLAQDEAFVVGDARVVLLDPTEILARRCVSLGLSARA